MTGSKKGTLASVVGISSVGGLSLCGVYFVGRPPSLTTNFMKDWGYCTMVKATSSTQLHFRQAPEQVSTCQSSRHLQSPTFHCVNCLLEVATPDQYHLPYEDVVLDTSDHVKVRAYLILIQKGEEFSNETEGKEKVEDSVSILSPGPSLSCLRFLLTLAE